MLMMCWQNLKFGRFNLSPQQEKYAGDIRTTVKALYAVTNNYIDEIQHNLKYFIVLYILQVYYYATGID